MRAEAILSLSSRHSGLYVMEKENRTTADTLLHSLSGGNMAVLDQLYDDYRDDFIRWAGQRFHIQNRDDLIDAWHDTMIMFYENVRDKKLTHLTCEVKTYLFTIGYRRLLKMHDKLKQTDLVDGFDANMNIDESINVYEYEEVTEQQQTILKDAVKELPEKSRQILVMRFMDGKSVPEIMKALGYTSENAVSVTLSRGLKKLKEIISERMDAEKAWNR
ncbi:MAG: sigma-70 family RNA polymerase sigma factor [Saprospiraceae bacterium]